MYASMEEIFTLYRASGGWLKEGARVLIQLSSH